MVQRILQTPIPSTGSLELLAVAVLVWFFAVLLLRRHYGNALKHWNELVLFLTFFVGVVALEVLILQ